MRISIYYNNTLYPKSPEKFTAQQRHEVINDIIPRMISEKPYRNTDEMELIWAGEVVNEERDWLDWAFHKFNVGDYGGRNDLRSMSIGDLVVIEHSSGKLIGSWACAPQGWQSIPRPTG